MREYEVIITTVAEQDLQEIFTYIASELLEPEIAINLCDRIEQPNWLFFCFTKHL